ncbi:MAG: AraC family transcriptional regulator [Caldilineaceae bacterium]
MQVKLDRKHDWISQRGDTIVVPRGLPAHFTNQANGESDIVIFSLPSDIWQNTVELDLGGYDRQIELRPFAGQDPDPLLHGLGWALCRQMRSSTERNQLYLESLVHTLTMHLVLNYAIVRPRCLSNRTGLSPAAMRDICDYVEANLTHELSLAELAAVAQYSPYYLARLFRSATGQSVHQYVTARRLAKAEALLTTTDLSLQQIAHAAGFSDQSHLSNQFRKTYGCAPNTVRKQHRPN